MSILIKGMEMPTNGCKDCIFVNRKWFGDVCPFLKREVTGNVERGGSQTDCPLVPVPEPHGRLGDLDKLEKMFADIDSAPYSCFDGAEPFYSAEDAAHIIRLAPTVIPASGEGET